MPPCFNIAHRGARSLAPENTMPAFRKAYEVGAHGVETDVSVTADGALILLHDITFRRTTDVARVYPERRRHQVHTFTLDEIGKLDAGSWFVENDPFTTIADGSVTAAEAQAMRHARIPLLQELLLFARQRSWFVNIELKRLPEELADYPLVENVLGLLDRQEMQSDLYSISSYEHGYLDRVRELRPEVEVNALIGEDFGRPQDWGDYRFEIYGANVDLIDDEQIAMARNNGCRINLYTVNRTEEMRYYLGLGVGKIITDYPQLLAGLDLSGSY